MTKKDILGVITASILGDGYARGNQLTFRHSTKQKDYLIHKSKLLNPRGVFTTTLSEKLDTKHPYVSLYYSNKTVGRAREKIFVEGKKTLTEGVLNQLGTLGLAIWYMDDGSLILHKYPDGSIKSREVYWSTESLDLESHNVFKEWMKRKYDIDIKINSYKKGKYYRTIINATNANKLFKLIEPHIVPSMNYKIDMCYSKDPSKTRRPL